MNNLDFRMQTLLDSARQDGECFAALKIHVARVYEMISALTMGNHVALEDVRKFRTPKRRFMSK